MDGSSAWWILFISLICIGVCYVLWLIIGRVKQKKMMTRIVFSEGEEPFTNPYKGWVVWANNPEGITQPCKLAYAPLYWRDLEEKKGLYDFRRFERENHFDYWRSKGVKIIIRFICDYPVKGQAHMDIPQWLHDEMDGDGEAYNLFYGMGFSPNYANEVMIEAHRAAVEAMGYRYNESPDVAFIQLGSLGHYGEWHIREDSNLRPFPKKEVADRYVRHYIDAFDTCKLLMRRGYPLAKEHGFGLYNDTLGDEDSTYRWLDWVKDGYVDEATQETMPDMQDFWMTAPSCGELSSEITLENLFSDFCYPNLVKMFDNCHTSFVGPCSPAYMNARGAVRENLQDCLRQLGYRFVIRYVQYNMSVKAGKPLKIELKFENVGSAPFYFDWKLTYFFFNDKGELVGKVLSSCDIRKVYNEYIDFISIPIDFEKGMYTIKTGIVNPDREDEFVCFSNGITDESCLHRLGTMIII